MKLRRKAFFDYVRRSPFPGKLSASQVTGMNAILDSWVERPEMSDVRWLAYQLATAKLETAHTMKPIKEYGSRSYFMRMYDKTGSRPHVARNLGNTQNGDGARYCGRGYVQLTGRSNYTKMSEVTGYDLVKSPGLALRHDIAAEIMHHGMANGTFTGRKLSHYFNRSTTDWYNARKIINGRDRASTIARYAQAFHSAIVKSKQEQPHPVLPADEIVEDQEAVENPITVTLKRHRGKRDTQPNVKEVQRMQAALGIKIDGSFGPGTENALKDFQKENGLKVDGIAGPVTLAALGLA